MYYSCSSEVVCCHFCQFFSWALVEPHVTSMVTCWVFAQWFSDFLHWSWSFFILHVFCDSLLRASISLLWFWASFKSVIGILKFTKTLKMMIFLNVLLQLILKKTLVVRKHCTFNWRHITPMLSDTSQIQVLIFCSIDMDNLAYELLAHPSEPYSHWGFSSLAPLDIALYLCLLSSIPAFQCTTANGKN